MRKIVGLFVICLFMGSLWNITMAQQEVTKAQAKFIYNFLRFIEWPDNAVKDNFEIDVFGSADIYNELKEYINNKSVGSKPILVKKVSSLDEISNCQLLFVAFDKTKNLKEINTKLKNGTTLIVTEKEGALDDGSAINFVLNEDKLSYEIKPSNATREGLKLSSPIITYARRSKA